MLAIHIYCVITFIYSIALVIITVQEWLKQKKCLVFSIKKAMFFDKEEFYLQKEWVLTELEGICIMHYRIFKYIVVVFKSPIAFFKYYVLTFNGSLVIG